MATKLEILSGLNEYQKNAVINYNGRMSLEAVPGSGKTFTLVRRCQYMIKDGVRPSRILVFTFTKKAANELKERIKTAIGPDADKMTICTYHSFCVKILRRFPEYTGRTKNFSIYDEDEKSAILKKIKDGFKQAPDRLGVIASTISKFKSNSLSPSQAYNQPDANSYDRVCAQIYDVYEKELIRNNAFDFDDLPYYAYKIMSTSKEVYDYVTNCFDYLLSDENQDANKQNMDFIMLLGSRTNNIFVVGDTDQSIYGFRGADVDNVIKTYKEQDFNINFLPLNYRSTQNIVKASNSVIKKNNNRILKEVKTENKEGNKIKYVKCSDQISEANFIAFKIKAIMAANPDMKYSDFAVLTRLQSETSLMEPACLARKIPYKIKGALPFFSRSEIKDIVSYLKLAFNPRDKVAFERIVNVPKRSLGPSSIEKIMLSEYPLDDIIENKVELNKLGITPKAKYGLMTFTALIRKCQELISENKTVAEIISFIISEIRYNDFLEKTIDVPGTLTAKKAYLDYLIYVANLYGTDVEEFLANSLSSDVENDREEKDCINVMTIHSSKGLEFRNVFIFDCTDNHIPFFLSHDSIKSVEEERRLFFVAMTRAKENLFLMFPSKTTRRNGTTDPTVESRFVREIPDKYLDKLVVTPKS